MVFLFRAVSGERNRVHGGERKHREILSFGNFIRYIMQSRIKVLSFNELNRCLSLNVNLTYWQTVK